MNQLFASTPGARKPRTDDNPGEAALTDIDKLYAKFATSLKPGNVSQGYDTNRTIDRFWSWAGSC
jgi:V/A-type H+-transporting ATPase subunit B